MDFRWFVLLCFQRLKTFLNGFQFRYSESAIPRFYYATIFWKNEDRHTFESSFGNFVEKYAATEWSLRNTFAG